MEEKTNFLEKFWYLFVILAVVLVGVIGGLWFNNQKVLQESSNQNAPVAEEITPTTEEDTQIAVIEQQSDSDEVNDIESDIQATDLSNLDKEMANIEAEIASP